MLCLLVLCTWIQYYTKLSLISSYFASKESDFPVFFKVLLKNTFPEFMKSFQSFSLDTGQSSHYAWPDYTWNFRGTFCLFVCLNHLTLIYDSFKHKRTPWRFPCMFGQVLHSSNGTTELGWEPTCDVTCLDLDNVGSDLHHHLLVHHSCHLTDQCPLGSMCPGQPPFIGKHRHLLRGQVTHDHLNAQN